MRNIRLVVEYDGTDWFGFQFQPDKPTIQAELERVLEKILKERVVVYGSGRTDAGVHAAGQVISFRTVGTIPIDRLTLAMNSLLPDSIVAISAEEVDNDFHARYSAKSRVYRYDILNAPRRSALDGRWSWHVRQPLDVETMAEAGRELVGVHDFTSFCCADRDDGSPIREMMSVSVTRERGDHLIIEMRANAFLRSMVRVIVGMLVEIGQGRRGANEMKTILEARDRRVAGKTAPARGLCLVDVEY